MFERFMMFVLKLALGLRYKISVCGLKQITQKQKTGILFLPNHPALIDPAIMMSILYKRFCPRPLADADRMDNPWLKKVFNRIRPIPIPDVKESGRAGKDAAKEAIGLSVDALKNGDNVLLYPSGRIYRSKHEIVGANGAVKMILEALPDVQIVLVRMHGLWGSKFTWASGHAPTFKGMGLYLRALFLGCCFFIPKRNLTVDFVEPTDFPKQESKTVINKYLENFYNTNAPGATHVPYYLFKGTRPIPMDEPIFKGAGNDSINDVPKETQEIITTYLQKSTGLKNIEPGHNLTTDLGLDSLMTVELMTWIEKEFGVPQEDVEAFSTVGDCFLAAIGELKKNGDRELKPVNPSWFKDDKDGNLQIPKGNTVAELFLAQAALNSKKVVISDQLRGNKTYQDIITAILALRPEIQKFQETNIGIMLPATSTAAIVYFATLFAGKTPVMVNWTVGVSNMQHSLNNAGVKHILTATALLTKIKKQGLDYSSMDAKLVALEEMGKQIGLVQKINAALTAKVSWRSLRKTKISETAAILFTSGSESKPKTVPLSHKNITTNMKDYCAQLNLKNNDKLLGMLPPFHSLGLAGNIIMPLCMGLKTVYHANPTEAKVLTQLAAAYKTTFLIATPTFLYEMLKSTQKNELDTIKLVATGAEKCPDHVYKTFNKICPKGIICEGYGITECSPVVSMNVPGNPVPGTIGKVLSSMEHLLIHPETGETITTIGQTGKLLVRGDNIFSGYYNFQGNSPFVEHDDKKWYDTGDLVSETADGLLTFRGRLKRFIKLAGEMISLPAVEEALLKEYSQKSDGIPLAVEATPEGTDKKPELVLFSTFDVTRENVNKTISDAGLSPLHSIRKIIKIEEIPILGTGKTDYRSLKKLI